MRAVNLSPLDEVAERVCVGYVGPSSDFFCEDGVPFLRTGNVGKKQLHLNEIKRVTPEFHSKQKKSTLKAGDVLVTRVVSDELKAAIVPPELAGGNCGNIIVVRPGKRLDPNYLMHLLSAPDSQKTLLGRQVGSAQSVINTAVLKSWQIPVLDLEEQRRIAAILDQAETLRTQRRAALALLDRLTQSLFLEMFGDVETNKMGFKVAALGSAIKLKSGNFLPASQMADKGQFPVYGGNGINGKHDEFMFEEPKIVIGRVGAYCGCVHVTEPRSWVTDNALYIETYDSALHPEYLAFALSEAKLNQYASQSGQPLISGARIAAVKLLIPPLPLQQTFATRIQAIEALKATHRQALATLDALFASLQQRAFAGQL